MKVVSKLLSKTVPKDVLKTQKSLLSAVKTGWEAGKRYSQINNKGMASDIFVKSEAIARKISVTKDDIPAFTAIVSSFLPFPCTTIAGYGLGHVIKATLNLISKGIK